VAAEEEVILGRHGEGVAHEGAAVAAEGESHAAGDTEESQLCQREGFGCVAVGGERYISGSFCVSMTAAMGMPKLEAGPQKSTPRNP
jgi:hypothetical protein